MAIMEGVITEEERFSLHGLKHRGITDSEDKRSGGHRTEAMRERYDHEIPIVEPPKSQSFPDSFTGTINKQRSFIVNL